jgi:Outer membrane cobalamin receptor protein
MTKTRLLLSAALFAQTAGAAHAQEAPLCPADNPDCADAIIVTGSRIARPRFETVEPALVVSSDAIEMRGSDSIGQALKEQPAFGTPGATPIGEQSPLAQGQSFVNFLGLGSQRTLTLVDGRRFVSSNTASIFGPTGAGNQVDLNLIPTKLVDRVETIAVGGAPIYGADAIAGTVNILLRRDFAGFELDGQAGISSRGDEQASASARSQGIISGAAAAISPSRASIAAPKG